MDHPDRRERSITGVETVQCVFITSCHVVSVQLGPAICPHFRYLTSRTRDTRSRPYTLRRRTTRPNTAGTAILKASSSSPTPPDSQPSKDDRPDFSIDRPTELTVSQQLILKQYDEQLRSMSEQECKRVAVSFVRQMLLRDNLLKSWLRSDIIRVNPPDPDKVDQDDDDLDIQL